MQHYRSDEQIARDEKAQAILQAGNLISAVEAKSVHKRHKMIAKRAKNLQLVSDDRLLPIMHYEKLLLEQRLDEINKYLSSVEY